MKINNKNIVFVLFLFISSATVFCVLYFAFRMHYLVAFGIVALSMFYSLAFKWFAKNELQERYNQLAEYNAECMESLEEFAEVNQSQKIKIQNLEQRIHRFAALNNVELAEFGLQN
jgi:ABC-type bacteriocin/lantibiotic exporter with double-glycine peptidase domain